MTTHRALNEAPRPTSPGSRGGRDTEGRHGGRDRPSDVRRGGPKGDECDEDRGSRLERADEHGHGRHHPEGRDGRTHGVDAPPREGQTRAAGEHRAGSSRLGPAAIAQGVGDHEGGQIVGQHNIGDSCEPVRPALGAQPQASRSTHLPCGIPRLCPTADDTGAGTPYRPTDDRERQLHLG